MLYAPPVAQVAGHPLRGENTRRLRAAPSLRKRVRRGADVFHFFQPAMVAISVFAEERGLCGIWA